MLADRHVPAHSAQEGNTLAGTSLAELNYPLLETQDEWVLHGFSYANYLQELGDKAQPTIYEKSSVDLALKDAFRKMRAFLMNTKGLSEDEAISLMSIAVDFGSPRWSTATGASTPSSRRACSPARWHESIDGVTGAARKRNTSSAGQLLRDPPAAPRQWAAPPPDSASV